VEEIGENVVSIGTLKEEKSFVKGKMEAPIAS
jgi:hypothetical protein